MAEKKMKTVAVVKPPREFETNDGKPLTAHDVVFDDAEEGSVITSRATDEVQAMNAALVAVKGQETEFELDNPREYGGVQKWKIVSFPGKPKGSGGGGRGQREWVDTTPSMEAQGAVKNAIAAIGMYHPEKYETMSDYLGLVREMSKGLHAIVKELKPASTVPEQPKTSMQEDAIRVFGSEGAVQVAYKKMFGEGTSFPAIKDDELEALIEQKAREE